MSHASLEQLVDVFAGDATDDTIEAHVFECDACAARYVEVAALCEGLRTVIPPVISQTHRDRLVATGTRIHHTQVEAGVEVDATFAGDLDLLVHVLRGDFARADRVDVAIVSPDGATHGLLEAVPFAPGEVLIACQRHYATLFPGDPTFVVTVTEAGAARRASYRVRHHFPV